MLCFFVHSFVLSLFFGGVFLFSFFPSHRSRFCWMRNIVFKMLFYYFGIKVMCNEEKHPTGKLNKLLFLTVLWWFFFSFCFAHFFKHIIAGERVHVYVGCVCVCVCEREIYVKKTICWKTICCWVEHELVISVVFCSSVDGNWRIFNSSQTNIQLEME